MRSALALLILLLAPYAASVTDAFSWNSSYLHGSPVSLQFPPPRSQYSVVQLSGQDLADPGQIVLMGGIMTAAAPGGTPQVFNDVWTSIDEGSTWTKTSDQFPARYQAASCTYESVIFVIGGMLSGAQPALDSYISEDGGASWANIVDGPHPFLTDVNTQCIMYSAGLTNYLFLWLGNSHFGEAIQLWRAQYLGLKLVHWQGISTPSSDGSVLFDRSNYAIRFTQTEGQLYVAGGYTSDQSFNIVQETLWLKLSTTSNTSAWTRSTNSNWPSSSSQQPARLVFDRDQLPPYLYTPSDSSSAAPIAGLTMWIFNDYPTTKWVPINQDDVCGTLWNPAWSDSTTVVSSETYDTTRYLFLDQQLMNPTLMLTIVTPDSDSSNIIASEGFVSISSCPDEPKGRAKWIIYVSIAGGVLFIGACVAFCLYMRKRRKEVGINTPLLNKV